MNIQQIMAQAQKMQRDLTSKQAEIDKMDFTGKSEWVEISFKGNKKATAVKIITDEAFDKENADILSDMILIAINDGLGQIDKVTEEKLGSYSKMGGLF